LWVQICPCMRTCARFPQRAGLDCHVRACHECVPLAVKNKFCLHFGMIVFLSDATAYMLLLVFFPSSEGALLSWLRYLPHYPTAQLQNSSHGALNRRDWSLATPYAVGTDLERGRDIRPNADVVLLSGADVAHQPLCTMRVEWRCVRSTTTEVTGTR
jgi:hypothetical protein